MGSTVHESVIPPKKRKEKGQAYLWLYLTSRNTLIPYREEHDRRACEANIKELQIRLEESESNALRGGKKLIEKLEHQVRNLNEELDTEQRFKADLTKNMRKCERRYREIEFQHEEEKKITERLQVNCIQFTLKYEHQRKKGTPDFKFVPQ